jgi:hypothetical protein
MDIAQVSITRPSICRSEWLRRPAFLEQCWAWMSFGLKANRDGRVKILAAVPESGVEIALNVDSLTEMPVTVALEYMRLIAQHAKLLSINHKKNFFSAGEAAAYSGDWRCKRDMRARCGRNMWKKCSSHATAFYPSSCGGTFC